MALRATASAVASSRDGQTYFSTLRSQAPLSLRPTLGGLTLVSSAFTPLGGDQLSLHIEVQAGARLAVGTAGAQVAQPGPTDPVSRSDVSLVVAAGAGLRWRPEPLVVTSGAEHQLELTVTAGAGAHLLIAETVVLGGGRYRGSWRVDYDGAPLLAADLDLGPGAPPGWDGPAGTGGARIVLTALLLAPSLVPAGPFGDGGEVLALAGPGALLLWLGEDPLAARRCLDAFVQACPMVPPELSGSAAHRSGSARA